MSRDFVYFSITIIASFLLVSICFLRHVPEESRLLAGLFAAVGFVVLGIVILAGMVLFGSLVRLHLYLARRRLYRRARNFLKRKLLFS